MLGPDNVSGREPTTHCKLHTPSRGLWEKHRQFPYFGHGLYVVSCMYAIPSGLYAATHCCYGHTEDEGVACRDGIARRDMAAASVGVDPHMVC